MDQRQINGMNNTEPHPALLGMLRALPMARVPIPETEKDEFMRIFRLVLDYVYPTKTEEVDVAALAKVGVIHGEDARRLEDEMERNSRAARERV